MKPGSRVDRYILGDEIGRGGFGSVHRATNAFSGNPVALKLLHSVEGDNGKRFLWEAKAAATIGHPNIVNIFDAGVTDAGIHFLAMELLQGAPLSRFLRNSGPLSWAEAEPLANQMSSALFAAHQAGVIHRDLKPPNIFVGARPDGSRKITILDFGISKMRREGSLMMRTGTGVVLGTPQYAAPEQLLGSPNLDGRCDQYALCVVLYEMLSGVRPHRGANYEQMLLAIIDDEPEALSDRVPSLPAFVADAIMRGLSKDPRDRFEDLESMRAALGFGVSVEHSLPTVQSGFPAAIQPTRRAKPAPAPPPRPPTEVAPAVASAKATSSRQPHVLAFGIVLGAAAIATIAVGVVLIASRLAGAPPTLSEVSAQLPEFSNCGVQPVGQVVVQPNPEYHAIHYWIGTNAGSHMTLALGDEAPGRVELSTPHNRITGFSFSVVHQHQMWTNYDPLPAHRDRISGTLDIHSFDRETGSLDATFHNVRLLDASGNLCEVDGRFRAEAN